MKKILGKTLSFIYFFSCFFVVFTMHVHAYIDPSVVTYIIQGVAGVLIALGAVFSIFRHKIFAFFKSLNLHFVLFAKRSGIALHIALSCKA